MLFFCIKPLPVSSVWLCVVLGWPRACGEERAHSPCSAKGEVGSAEDCCSSEKTWQERVCVQASCLPLGAAASMGRVGTEVGAVAQAGFRCAMSAVSLAAAAETL